MLERKLQKSPMFIGLYIVILSIIFSPSVVFAQENNITDESRPAILPDSIFYGIKLAIENLREAITIQEEKRAELILKHSEERDKEALELERQGKDIPIELLREIQAKKLMKAEEIILRLESKQMMIDKQTEERQERQILQQASNEQERLKIQMEQAELKRSENIRIVEPDLSGKPKLIEPTTPLRADQPFTIKPVDDIKEGEDDRTVLQKLKIRLENSFSTSEITEIRAKFHDLRTETDVDKQILLAEELDEKVNNPMVSITCFGRVNTFSIAKAPDPVRELQDQCPLLRPLPAEELRKLSNTVG